MVQRVELFNTVVEQFLELREEHLVAIVAAVVCHVGHDALTAHEFTIIIDRKDRRRDERDTEL